MRTSTRKCTETVVSSLRKFGLSFTVYRARFAGGFGFGFVAVLFPLRPTTHQPPRGRPKHTSGVPYAVITASQRRHAGRRALGVNHPRVEAMPPSTSEFRMYHQSGTLTSEQLKSYFEKYGNVLDVYLPKDSMSGQTKGYGFTTFETEEEITKAVRLLC